MFFPYKNYFRYITKNSAQTLFVSEPIIRSSDDLLHIYK